MKDPSPPNEKAGLAPGSLKATTLEFDRRIAFESKTSNRIPNGFREARFQLAKDGQSAGASHKEPEGGRRESES
jgi:hypothetical protein